MLRTFHSFENFVCLYLPLRQILALFQGDQVHAIAHNLHDEALLMHL